MSCSVFKKNKRISGINKWEEIICLLTGKTTFKDGTTKSFNAMESQIIMITLLLDYLLELITHDKRHGFLLR